MALCNVGQDLKKLFSKYLASLLHMLGVKKRNHVYYLTHSLPKLFARNAIFGHFGEFQAGCGPNYQQLQSTQKGICNMNACFFFLQHRILLLLFCLGMPRNQNFEFLDKKLTYLIRTNFRGHLISRIWNTNISRAIIFAILQKMINLGDLISRKLTKDRLKKQFFID